MAVQDIGENLVGSWLRYIAGCAFVVFNTQVSGVQGEIDVLGMTLQPEREVIICEVATHIRGLNYGSYQQTVDRIRHKITRASQFVDETMAGWHHRYEVWSPVVPEGQLTDRLDHLAATYSDDQLDVAFIINDRYATRIQQLVDHAQTNPSATSEPAYRMLQILTHLRGDLQL